jgi:hypothetical protein
MSIRVSYHSTEREGIFHSSHYTSETGSIYMIELNMNTMSYRVKNVNSGRFYEGSDNIANKNVLYRTARNHLVRLGVVLKTDMRNYKEKKTPYEFCKKEAKNGEV